ncbi:MAG: hypothetical protein VX004_10495 [SAR324 cluster bacterium]|nr:hypothetical protein [SAR324 cluster bacterium]
MLLSLPRRSVAMLLAVDSLSLIVGLRLECDAEGWLCAEEVL